MLREGDEATIRREISTRREGGRSGEARQDIANRVDIASRVVNAPWSSERPSRTRQCPPSPGARESASWRDFLESPMQTRSVFSEPTRFLMSP